MTYDAYKAQMTRNQEQVEQNEKDLQIKPAEIEALRGLPQPINVLALAEAGAAMSWPTCPCWASWRRHPTAS